MESKRCSNSKLISQHSRLPFSVTQHLIWSHFCVHFLGSGFISLLDILQALCETLTQKQTQIMK